MKPVRYTLSILALVLIGTLIGCDANGPESKAGVFVGETKSLGDGVARSWVELNDGGLPVALGVTFNETTLTSLLAAGKAAHDETSIALALPAEASQTVYDHITLDWNPQGHAPPGIYDIPHFDVHFYMISDAEQDAITPQDPDFGNKAEKRPAPEYIPAGYIATPGAVPRMGAHWVDPSSPEFNGQPFTETVIYGFYDAKMVFVEPMISAAFLQSRPNMTEPLKLPAQYAETGLYPTRYSVRYDAAAGEYTIALEELVLRVGE